MKLVGPTGRTMPLSATALATGEKGQPIGEVGLILL